MADPSVKTKKKSEKEPNNLYNTPSEALEAVESQYGLLGYYDSYYDPCNGLGKISEYLKDLGKEVITGDLVDYSQYGSEADYIEDFLKVEVFEKLIDKAFAVGESLVVSRSIQ